MTDDTLDLIAGEISPRAAQALVTEAGGKRIYIPRAAPPGHPLAEMLGAEAAARLCELLGPGHIDIPTGARAAERARAARIEELGALDYSNNEIARLVGCSERTVRRRRRRQRRPETTEG